MKKPRKKRYALCKACRFIRTFGFSRRPHELDLATFVIAFVIALAIAGIVRFAMIMIVAVWLCSRYMHAREERRKLLDLAKNGAPNRARRISLQILKNMAI